MKPSRCFRSDEKPCIATLYLTAFRVGRDRLCMVMPAQPGKTPPGLAILLIGGDPLREIGPSLIELFKSFPNPEGHTITMENESSFAIVFQAMRESSIAWTYGEQIIQGRKITAILCLGQSICEQVAAILNQHHCPTNLT